MMIYFIALITIFPVLISSQDMCQKIQMVRKEIETVKSKTQEKQLKALKKLNKALKGLELAVNEIDIQIKKRDYDAEYELQEYANSISKSLNGKEIFKQKND